MKEVILADLDRAGGVMQAGLYRKHLDCSATVQSAIFLNQLNARNPKGWMTSFVESVMQVSQSV